VALGAVFVPAAVMGAGAVKVPFKFNSGSQIKAQEMNDNISALKKAIDGKGAVATTAIGTLTLAGFNETIPIRRYTHNLAMVLDDASGTGTGRADVGDLEVSCALGNLSPLLNRTLNQGQHLARADLAMGPLLIRLDNVQLSGILVDDVVDGVPLQQLRIAFNRIEWTWQEPGQPSRSVFFDRAMNQGGGGGGTTPQYAFFGPGVTPDPNFIGITGYTTDQGCTLSGGTGQQTCRVDHSPFVVTKTAIGVHLLDDLAAVTRGPHLQEVDVQWFRAGASGPELQHQTTLESVQAVSVQMTTGTDGNLTESVGYVYDRIRWSAGGNEASWDLSRNSEIP
jgi:type VI protein secretion system component Hcp